MPKPSRYTDKTHRLPRQLTRFVGRQQELTEIRALLDDPACLLLTLIGPGGIGKTRLAIEVATQNADAYNDGIFFVSLQSVSSTNALDNAIADALGLPLSRQNAPKDQLVNFLRDRQMLLILDNFEHLLAEPMATAQEASERGRALLTDLLVEASGVNFLVTSREALSIQAEWRYPLGGLPFPSGDEREAKVEGYDAVQLFVACARRTRPNFSLAGEEDDVVRICRLVEGMPLALELAAAWTQTMRCAALADEIQRNIDFLATTFHNVPDRQRSIRAIFNQSWQMLSADERDIFVRLSIFRGGFDRAAAEDVAGASLAKLTVLVGKSLLRWDPPGRYYIHELLRQYAAEQLAQEPDGAAAVSDGHCQYYARFLQQREPYLVGTEQQETIQKIAAELGNIQAAWQWALQQTDIDAIRRAAYAYYFFCDFQGRYLECSHAFEQALVRLDQAGSGVKIGTTQALLHVLQGWNYIRLGSFEEARVAFEQGQHLYQVLAVETPAGFGTDPLPGLALLSHILGDNDAALVQAEEARSRNLARDDKLNLQIAYYVLGTTFLAQGNYTSAEESLRQSQALAQETHNQWMIATAFNELGNVALRMDDIDQALRHYQAGYQLMAAVADPEGMARSLVQQGNIALLEHAYAEAEQLYHRGIAVYEDINDLGGLAKAKQGAARAAGAQNRIQVACANYAEALGIANSIQFTSLVLALLADIGELLLKAQRLEAGLELLAVVSQHSASDYETKAQTARVLEQRRATLPPEVLSRAMLAGENAALNPKIAVIQSELVALKDASAQPDVAGGVVVPATPRPTGSAGLVEPLTPREAEVLQLMAQGLTNKQIAETLIISVGTVKWYTSEIYGKLAVSNRTQAVARASALDLLS